MPRLPGFHHSQETKEKMRLAQLRSTHVRGKPWLGKKLPPDMVARMRKNRKGIVAKVSPEARAAHSERMRARNPMKLEINKEKIRLSKLGSKNPQWKGGIWSDQEHRNAVVRMGVIRRRARLAKALGNFTLKEWEKVKRVYQFLCASCKKSEPEIKLTVDHIVPILLGGSNSIENIQPLCGPCNSSKCAKLDGKAEETLAKHLLLITT